MAKKLRKNYLAAFLRRAPLLQICPKIVYCICMYVRVRTSVKNTRKKFYEKSCENIWWSGLDVVTLHPDKT